MELFHAIETRRSVRKFTEEPVSAQLLTQIVEAARFSPSWKNSQTPGYIAVCDTQLKTKIGEECCLGFAHNATIIGGCPALVVVTTQKNICGFEPDGTPTTSKGEGWEMFDAGVAAQTFSLAAHGLGLGSVILGVFDEEKVREALELPETVGVAAMIALGHPAKEGRAPARKSVEELLTIR